MMKQLNPVKLNQILKSRMREIRTYGSVRVLPLIKLKDQR